MRTRLNELVIEKGKQTGKTFTQIEVAVAAGVSLSTISRWMSNKVDRYDADTIDKLCEFLDCEVGDLIYRERSAEAS